MFERKELCRVCGNSELKVYLDLGETPLANNLIVPGDSRKEERFPLQVAYCPECSLSQLAIVVNPSALFSHYVYRSSISKTFQEHCREMADYVSEKKKKEGDSLCVDIASNDGCLLREFKLKGYKVLGVEPATNLAKIAVADGIETVNDFWSFETARRILKTHGNASVITATNVFAHIDDLHGFLEGVNALLKTDGIFILEFPYMIDLVEKNEFDTVYHEHLSYFLVKPLKILLERHGFRIADIVSLPIHGGSIRVCSVKENNDSVEINEKATNGFLEREKVKGLYDFETYSELSFKAKKVRGELLMLIDDIAEKNKSICAYGAAAKGNTLLNYCGINFGMIEYIVDDTPEKQNHLAPGSRIPIVSNKMLSEKPADYMIILAWNFANEIMAKTKDFRERGGKYIIPIPDVRVV